MRSVLILMFLVLMSKASTQDIISGQFVTSGIVTLGGNAQIQFTVNQETLCDSYIISTNINYTGKIIDVNVDYNYVSTCGESNALFVEIPSFQLVLEGVYIVNLNLNVATKPEWNRVFSLGSISVIPPDLSTCAAGGIPSLQGFCPGIFNLVCACDGQTYDNECFAYLDARNGNYVSSTCPSVILSKAESFDCATFNSIGANFFEKYNCSSGLFSGDEVVLLYNHLPNSPSQIQFTSPENDVQLFLINSLNSNLVCTVASNSDNILDLTGIGEGQHILVADKPGFGNISVTFCDPVSSVLENTLEDKSTIYPNPSNGQVQVTNPTKNIRRIELISRFGAVEKSWNVNASSAPLDLERFSGIYFLRLMYQDDSSEIRKIVMH